MRIAALAFLATTVVAMFIGFRADATEPIQRTAGMSVLLVPLVVGGLCESRVRLAITAHGIGGRTAFRGTRSVTWSDVRCVDYWEGAAHWVLIDRNGGRLRIPRYLRGSATLPDVFAAKLQPAIWSAAVARWRKHRGE